MKDQGFSKVMRKSWAGFLLIILCGCSTVPDEYKPSTIGISGSGDVADGLGIYISTKDNMAIIGQPLYFKVKIRNNSALPVLVPKNPNVVFTWIYPDGSRDNFLRDLETERYYAESDLVLLKPNQFIVREIKVDTYYFDRPGITEFRAILQAGRNTNPGCGTCWSGQIASHGYGILLERRQLQAYNRTCN